MHCVRVGSSEHKCGVSNKSECELCECVSVLISFSFSLSCYPLILLLLQPLLERSVQMSASHPSHALTHCLVKSFGIIKHHHLILLTGYLLLPLTITAPSTLISICFCILLLCHFFHHFLASFFFFFLFVAFIMF